MALFKGSAAVGAISGKAGGSVFSHNKGGAYLKVFTVPTNPNTAKQQAVRTDFATLVASWKNLTAAQQQLWTDIAPQYPYVNRVGDTKTYTGQMLYIKLNQNLKVVGATILTTPRVPGTFTAIVTSSLTMVLTAGVLTTADAVNDVIGLATESLIWTITTSQSGGITKPGNGAFKIVEIVTDASVSATTDIIVTYQALYGDPKLGSKIFARCAIINELTGQRLEIGQEEATVTGT